jgi:TonB family protein
MSLLLESAIKGSLIVLMGLAVLPLLRKQAAALRHWVLAAALVCAATAPVATRALPTWELPVNLTPAATASVLRTVASPLASRQLAPSETRREDVESRAVVTILYRTWIAGLAVSALLLLVGLARLRYLALHAVRLREGAWVEMARDISREYGLREPFLLQTQHPSLLVTWGMRQPRILLPSRARSWSDERIRLVLSHELAHARRGDWLITLGAGFLCAVYWFNPIVWFACRRLRQESEQACDDIVLSRGVEGADYAAQLVDIVRELQHQRRAWVPALSIARPSTLERRVRAMLDTQVNRRPMTRSIGVATLLALALVTIPVTSVVVAQVFTTMSGSIVDPTNGALADVTLVLTNTQTQAKYEVRSDRSGRYEFVGLPPGDYALEATLPAFAAFKGKLRIAASHLQQDLKLEVGSLRETINVRASASGSGTANPTTVGTRRVTPAAPPQASKCTQATSQDGTPLGGNIRPPMKLFDVRPIYPASAVSAGASGVVVLDARIGADGNVEDVRTVSAPNPDLAASATDAVVQWQFTPTILNCAAIPVSMTVRVNFELEK